MTFFAEPFSGNDLWTTLVAERRHSAPTAACDPERSNGSRYQPFD